MFRVCSKPGCPTIHNGPGARCPQHRKEASARHTRDTAAYRGAGHRKRFRPGVLERDPICLLCNLRASTVADHYPRSRRELIDLGMDPDDPAYGRGLCADCHNKETARNQPGGWNQR